RGPQSGSWGCERPATEQYLPQVAHAFLARERAADGEEAPAEHPSGQAAPDLARGRDRQERDQRIGGIEREARRHERDADPELRALPSHATFSTAAPRTRSCLSACSASLACVSGNTWISVRTGIFAATPRKSSPSWR